jgi:hypothetical protein
VGRPLKPALVCAIALCAAPAAGATNFVALQFRADPGAGCVSEGAFRGLVARQLGYDPFRPDAPWRLSVDLTRTDARFEGHILWTDAAGRTVGERVLSSRERDCRRIGADVAFAVTVGLQLRNAAPPPRPAAPPPEPAPPPPPPPPVQPTIPAAAAPPPAVEAPRPALAPPPPAARPPPHGTTRPRFSLRVGGGPALVLGLEPGAAPAARLFAAARAGALSGELGLDAALAATAREPDGTGASVEAMGAALAGCGHYSAVAACAVARLSRLQAHGQGVDAPQTGSALLGQVGARLGLAHAFGRLTLGVQGDLLITVARSNVLLNQVVVWQTPRVGGIFSADVAFRVF